MIATLEDLPITLPLAAITQFCRDHAVARLALFGSVLRDDFAATSDIDLLVTYLPGAGTTLLDMVQQEQILSSLLGRVVDLRTPQELSPYFRQAVLDSAVTIYERD